jgi:uncharacterized protein with beta-barrel porin domain
LEKSANRALAPRAGTIAQRIVSPRTAGAHRAYGSGFTVVSNRFGEDTRLIGIGITQEVSADVKLFVNNDARLQSNFTSHTISAGLRVKF